VIAHDQNGIAFVVFAKAAPGMLFDTYGNPYRRVTSPDGTLAPAEGDAIELEIYEGLDEEGNGTDRITVQVCECQGPDDLVPGAFVERDDSDDRSLSVNRCDTCKRFDDDDDAAEAFAAALNLVLDATGFEAVGRRVMPTNACRARAAPLLAFYLGETSPPTQEASLVATVLAPTVHLNGTGRAGLVAQLEEALEALRSATEALGRAQPNGRDYYPQGDRAIKCALKEHTSRMQRLESVQAELAEILARVAQ
jgi:hypothetical protein